MNSTDLLDEHDEMGHQALVEHFRAELMSTINSQVPSRVSTISPSLPLYEW